MRFLDTCLGPAMLFAAVLLLRPAAAEAGPVEGGLFVGSDTINSSDDAGARASGDDLFMLGLRFALAFGMRFEVEAESKIGRSTDEDAPLLLGWRASGIFKLNPRAPVKLFLLGGGGGETALEGNGTGPMVQLGMGAKVDVGRRLGFRLDGRQLFTRLDDRFVPSYELHVGFYVRFGRIEERTGGDDLQEGTPSPPVDGPIASAGPSRTNRPEGSGEPAIPPGLEEEPSKTPEPRQPTGPRRAGREAPPGAGKDTSDQNASSRDAITGDPSPGSTDTSDEESLTEETEETRSELVEEPVRQPGRPALELARKIARVAFHERGSRLTASGRRRLDRAIKVIEKYPELAVVIDGYAGDADGWRASHELSLQRAKAVKAHLVRRGVSPGRIKIRGHGSKRASAAATGRKPAPSRERRVVVSIVLAAR